MLLHYLGILHPAHIEKISITDNSLNMNFH